MTKTKTQEYYRTVTLTAKTHQVARQFALQQDTVEKGKQVYLNTLAILAVRDFLEEISFEADLNLGDSWNPAVRCFHDVADLVIPGIGKLECRPILETQTSVYLPPEVRENRIGYVAVQFQEQLNKVKLRGFCRALDPSEPSNEINTNDLEPIEDLIDYLFRLEIAKDMVGGKIEEHGDMMAEYQPEIIAQLERIYRSCSHDDWRFEGSKVLALTTGRASRSPSGVGARTLKSGVTDDEMSDEDDEYELQELAEELLEELNSIWGDAA